MSESVSYSDVMSHESHGVLHHQQLFVQQLVHAKENENIEPQYCRPSLRGFHPETLIADTAFAKVAHGVTVKHHSNRMNHRVFF